MFTITVGQLADMLASVDRTAIIGEVEGEIIRIFTSDGDPIAELNLETGAVTFIRD